MTFTSVAQANSKIAQFAHLFDLFDRVATRRNRAPTGDTSEVISLDDIANVPAEFAPILKKLSTTLSLRAIRDEAHARRVQVLATSTARMHRNAPASIPFVSPTARKTISGIDIVEGDPETPTFPLAKRYPFTFKLMLHKLYDLDEWAEKVKDAVEASKSQFKPLAERVQNVLGDATANINDRMEDRNNIHPILGASAMFKPLSSPKSPHSSAMPSSKLETSHVLKKRCIGRRKSLSGPISTGVWVYDTVISATEVTGPRPTLDITLSAPRGAGVIVESRTRHQSMTALGEVHGRGTTKRKIRFAVPLLQENVPESVPPQRLPVSTVKQPQEIIKSEKGWSATSAVDSGASKTATVMPGRPN